MTPLVYFQLLSVALFVIGMYGVLGRRSAVLIVMSIELMLNAVNINTREAPSTGMANSLFTRWAFPFEVASLVLLVALIGAIIIARTGDGGDG